MKNPRNNEPADPAAARLKFRFVEKKHGFGIFFRREAPILVRQPPDQTFDPLCTAGFRGESPLSSSTVS
jgi:hypothetical protein